MKDVYDARIVWANHLMPENFCLVKDVVFLANHSPSYATTSRFVHYIVVHFAILADAISWRTKPSSLLILIPINRSSIYPWTNNFLVKPKLARCCTNTMMLRIIYHMKLECHGKSSIAMSALSRKSGWLRGSMRFWKLCSIWLNCEWWM